jgi:lipopolysaccharide assembly protein A
MPHMVFGLKSRVSGGAGPGGPGALGAAEGKSPTPQPASQPTRSGTPWLRVILVLVFLGLVLLFIFQNLHHVRVSFITAHWSGPLGVDLLLAAVLGGVVVAAVGAARIFQRGRVARRHHRAHLKAGEAK